MPPVTSSTTASEERMLRRRRSLDGAKSGHTTAGPVTVRKPDGTLEVWAPYGEEAERRVIKGERPRVRVLRRGTAAG